MNLRFHPQIFVSCPHSNPLAPVAPVQHLALALRPFPPSATGGPPPGRLPSGAPADWGLGRKTLPRTSPGLWLGPEYPHLWALPGGSWKTGPPEFRSRSRATPSRSPVGHKWPPGPAGGSALPRLAGGASRPERSPGCARCPQKAPAEGSPRAERVGPNPPATRAPPHGRPRLHRVPASRQAGPDGLARARAGEGRAGRAPPAERPGAGLRGAAAAAAATPAPGQRTAQSHGRGGPRSGKGGPRRAQRSERGRSGRLGLGGPGEAKGEGGPASCQAQGPGFGAAPTTEQKTPLSGSRQRGGPGAEGHRRRARVWDCSLSASCGLRTSCESRLPIPLGGLQQRRPLTPMGGMSSETIPPPGAAPLQDAGAGEGGGRLSLSTVLQPWERTPQESPSLQPPPPHLHTPTPSLRAATNAG